ESTNYDAEIAKLTRTLEAAEARLRESDQLLADVRASETTELEPVPGYKGTKARIAVRANDERGRRGWIDDRIAHGAVCPNYQFGWEQLADYHESLTDELRDELGRALLDPPFSSDDAV